MWYNHWPCYTVWEAPVHPSLCNAMSSRMFFNWVKFSNEHSVAYNHKEKAVNQARTAAFAVTLLGTCWTDEPKKDEHIPVRKRPLVWEGELWEGNKAHTFKWVSWGGGGHTWKDSRHLWRHWGGSLHQDSGSPRRTPDIVMQAGSQGLTQPLARGLRLGETKRGVPKRM